MHWDDVASALASPETLAILGGHEMQVKDDEVRVVAQAITDAHAKRPGGDCEGRLDDAKTIIAAVDALTRHRKLQDVAEHVADASRTRPARLPDASSAPADASASGQDASSIETGRVTDASQPVTDASSAASDASQVVVPIKGKRGRKPGNAS